MIVYWAETDCGQKMEWPKGLRVVSRGEYNDLAAALHQYGQHTEMCRVNNGMRRYCTCGLNDLLVKTAHAAPQKGDEQ